MRKAVLYIYRARGTVLRADSAADAGSAAFFPCRRARLFVRAGNDNGIRDLMDMNDLTRTYLNTFSAGHTTFLVNDRDAGRAEAYRPEGTDLNALSAAHAAETAGI